MIIWQLLAICGICFLLLEMFTPSLFFLNFALASFITAGISLWVTDPYHLTLIFFVFSFVSFIFLRPVLVKKFNKSKETGLNDKYIGKLAKAETDITENSGSITIYGERWDARTEGNAVIPQGSEVKILRNESIIMYVSAVNN